MNMRIKDMVVVITGASGGIGRATAIRFGQMGAAVVLAARREEALRATASECDGNWRTLVVPTDVTDEGAVERLAQEAIKTFGRIDVWVNNAGVYLLGQFDRVPSDAFRRVMDTNFFGCIHGARAAIPLFRDQNHGVLINMASVNARMAEPCASAYVASKFAIRGFGEALRRELHGTGIHVCTVLPGPVDTPLFQQSANYYGRTIKAPPGTIQAETVARTIVRLALRPRPEVYVGPAARAAVWLNNVAPRFYDRTIIPRLERSHFESEDAPDSSGNLFEPNPQYATISGGWTKRFPGRGIRISLRVVKLLGLATAVWFLIRRRLKAERAAGALLA